MKPPKGSPLKGRKKGKKKKRGQATFIIKSTLSPFVNGSIQFSPTLLSFQRVLLECCILKFQEFLREK